VELALYVYDNHPTEQEVLVWITDKKARIDNRQSTIDNRHFEKSVFPEKYALYFPGKSEWI